MTIEGRVVGDPELRFAPSGVAVGRMRVVASDRRKNDQGEWEDADTLWIDITCFKQIAENMAESIVDKDLIVAVGKIRTEQWEDKETGEKRSKIAMIADAVAADLKFRTIPHGAGRAQRSSEPARSNDPWSTGDQPDEPPF